MFNSEYEIGTAICLEEGGLVCFSPMALITSAIDTVFFWPKGIFKQIFMIMFSFQCK